MFSLIKLLAQLLHLITVRHQHNAPLRNLHRHAPPVLKPRFRQPVALKVQAGAERISGGDFDFTVGVGNADIADFKTALGFGKGGFKINIVFS